MKKLTAILLVFAMLFAFAACKGKPGADPTSPANPDGEPKTQANAEPETQANAEPITDANGNVLPDNLPEGALTAMRETFDNMEYTMYRNVFQDTSTKQFDGIQFTKVGTFAVLQDEWSGKLRYYVWGYADQTRCCDYQWEFVPPDARPLPTPGSYIRVKGTFTYTEDQKGGALDHYWITDCTLEVLEEYTPSKYDYDLTTMSATLARVQLFSLMNYTGIFEGKTVLVYGRAYSPTQLQHPYYDQSWYLDFNAEGKTPATGQYLLLGGVLNKADTESGCVLNVTSYNEV
jgi:hypothetical protein